MRTASRRTAALIGLSLLALGLAAAPASAHVHKLTITPPGNPANVQCANLPLEPAHVHDTIHPIHSSLHKGPGAPADNTEVVAHGDPLVVTVGRC